MIVLLVYV